MKDSIENKEEIISPIDFYLETEDEGKNLIKGIGFKDSKNQRYFTFVKSSNYKTILEIPQKIPAHELSSLLN